MLRRVRKKAADSPNVPILCFNVVTTLPSPFHDGALLFTQAATVDMRFCGPLFQANLSYFRKERLLGENHLCIFLCLDLLFY